MHGQREAAVLLTPPAGVQKKAVVTASEVFAAPDAGPDVALIGMARRHLSAGENVAQHDGWFMESVVGSDLNIAVFGAGHVGAAVVDALSVLDCNIRWIDSRRNIFRQVKPNVRTVETAQPALEVAAMPPASCYLVMTHSHAIDFEICGRILRRGDAAYCGLIGSLSKRRRFEKRYRAEGMPEIVLAQLVCPIGVAGISGKKPAEIAVAASAEVLQAHERARAGSDIAYPANVHRLKKDSP